MLLESFILEDNTFNLAEKIKKLSKKSIKNGFDPIKLTVTNETEIRKVVNGVNEDGSPIYVTKLFVKVIIEGTDPHFPGWNLIATVVHDEDLGTIFRVVPNKIVPVEFREVPPTRCDHCKTARFRNETFIVEKDGLYKVVGRSCAADFFAVDRITKYIWLAELPTMLGDMLLDHEEKNYGLRGSEAYNLDLTLGATMEVIERVGFYVSKAIAEEKMTSPTSADAVWAMTYSCHKTAEDIHYYSVKEEHKAEIEKIIAWAKETMNPDNSDFNYTLMKFVNAGYVKANFVGYVACLVPMYRKAMALIEEKKNAKPSEFVGKVGDKISTELIFLNSWAFSSYYGMCYINKFKNAEGDVFVWKTSNSEDFELGKTYKVKGTIKEHSVYREVKQNVITRCKVL